MEDEKCQHILHALVSARGTSLKTYCEKLHMMRMVYTTVYATPIKIIVSFSGIVCQNLETLIHNPPVMCGIWDTPLPPYTEGNPWVNQVFVTISVGRYVAGQHVYNMQNVVRDFRVVQPVEKEEDTLWAYNHNLLQDSGCTVESALVPSTFNDLKMYAVLLTKFANPYITERECLERVAKAYHTIVSQWEKANPGAPHDLAEGFKTFADPSVRRRMCRLFKTIREEWLGVSGPMMTFRTLESPQSTEVQRVKAGVIMNAKRQHRAYKASFPHYASLLDAVRPDKIAKFVTSA